MILALLLAAETAKLPAWNAKPPPGTAEAAVMAPVDALFAAIAARDGARVLPSVRAEGSVTSVGVVSDGAPALRRRSWAEWAAGMKPGPERYEEKLTDPAIEVDGDIAMVWSPYVFLIDGKMHHCGVDHFDLVRDNGAWKILNITWSQRTTGCEAR
jgi:hypothetical protein